MSYQNENYIAGHSSGSSTLPVPVQLNGPLSRSNSMSRVRYIEFTPYIEHSNSLAIDHSNINVVKEDSDEEGDEIEQMEGVSFAVQLSFVANVLLFAVKIIAAMLTGSLAVWAAVVDSFIDILSQGIIYLAERHISFKDKTNYPAGKHKLEPIAIILLATLMGCATLQIIIESSSTLFSGAVDGKYPLVDFSLAAMSILLAVIIVKSLLYWFCSRYSSMSHTASALATDHMNDVLSNIVAMATAYLAHTYAVIWWIDSLGAIAISLYIIQSWAEVALEQINMLIGKSAPPEFYARLTDIGNKHHPKMEVDVIRAYHFGISFLVEMEVILVSGSSLFLSLTVCLSACLPVGLSLRFLTSSVCLRLHQSISCSMPSTFHLMYIRFTHTHAHHALFLPACGYDRQRIA